MSERPLQSQVLALTSIEAVESLRFFHEAVELPHLAEGGLRPAILANQGRHLFTEHRCNFWILRQMVDSMRNTLVTMSTVNDGARHTNTDTHISRRMDGSEVQHQNPVDNSFERMRLVRRFLHEPHKHVILYDALRDQVIRLISTGEQRTGFSSQSSPRSRRFF